MPQEAIHQGIATGNHENDSLYDTLWLLLLPVMARNEKYFHAVKLSCYDDVHTLHSNYVPKL